MTIEETITVIKQEPGRGETWRYTGTLLHRRPDRVLLQALFNRDDMVHYGMPLGRGDRFVEAFFTGRWYNILEIHDRADDRLKGWYCNICLPAEISAGQISYVDLALDLLVFPDGRRLLLDEDEFAVLPIDDLTRARALAALEPLTSLFASPLDFHLDRL